MEVNCELILEACDGTMDGTVVRGADYQSEGGRFKIALIG